MNISETHKAEDVKKPETISAKQVKLSSIAVESSQPQMADNTAALGQGDTKTLSGSMLIAFDTTVAGLISAAICFIISGIRKSWYEQYVVGLETVLEIVLEEQGREEAPEEEITKEQFVAYARKLKAQREAQGNENTK